MWYYVPSKYCPSVPEADNSTSPSDWLCEALAQSATWNTKSLPASSWRRVLRTVPWMTRRSGLIYTASTADRGAAAFRESLAGIHANRSASPASDSGQPTRAISGRASAGSSMSRDQIGASTRTWRDTFDLDISTLYAPTSSALATELRRTSSRRRKSAALTNGSGSTSWPTPRGNENGEYQNERGDPDKPRATLTGAAKYFWQTPSVADGMGGHLTRGGNRNGEDLLPGQAKNWPTPDTQNARDGSHRREEAKGSHAVSLHHAVASWATPTAHDGRRPGPDTTSTQGRNLKRETEAWDRSRLDDATDAPDSLAGNVAAPSATPGDPSSSDTPTSPQQLNPMFAAWLMGWPPGWTSLAPSSSASPETEWSRWRLLMRSELSRLGWD